MFHNVETLMQNVIFFFLTKPAILVAGFYVTATHSRFISKFQGNTSFLSLVCDILSIEIIPAWLKEALTFHWNTTTGKPNSFQKSSLHTGTRYTLLKEIHYTTRSFRASLCSTIDELDCVLLVSLSCLGNVYQQFLFTVISSQTQVDVCRCEVDVCFLQWTCSTSWTLVPVGKTELMYCSEAALVG